MSIAMAQRLAGLTGEQRHAVLDGLSAEELAALEYKWEFWARDDQLPPPGDWRTWLYKGARGVGKTRTAAEWIRAEVEAGRRRQLGIIAPTADSLRRICVEGPSGILSVGPPTERPEFEPSTRRIVYANGGIVHLFSAEEPDRLRGPNLDGYWIDELTSMPNGGSEVWDTLQMALRIPGPKGHAPCGIITTTPKNQKLLKHIMASPTTVITTAKTKDNAANLDTSTMAFLYERYEGTRLGRQELEAELIEDTEGALWTPALIDACRIKRSDQPDNFLRIVVAVDPPGGSSKSNAECGIIVAALGKDRHGYVLADLSGRLSPEQWARKVVGAYHGYKADKIVAEQNFGGAMVESTIRSLDSRVPIKMVVASRGKQIRAEPVASWYEQHRVHHVGEFPALEDQMAGWDPAESGPSPDRVDALVWALTELMGGPAPMRISQEAVAASANMAPYPGTEGYFRRHGTYGPP
jgi:predicted phage terminase large subunit-like protein